MSKTFLQFDLNGDGLISEDEFVQAYKKLFPAENETAAEERAREIFKNADADGNGSIDFTEWCTATMD